MLRYLLFVVLSATLIVSGISAADDTQDLLDDIVSDYIEDDNALVVYLATPEGVWTVTAGFARDDEPTTVEDRFRIGSVSKTLVAVAALMLVEDGIFALDDPASDWLSDEILQNVANAESATIRQLLNMRSGIDDYLDTDAFLDAIEDDPQREWTAEDVLVYAYGLPALFAPDADFNYSNTNYILLQIILEEASAMGLHELIRERILEPLEMVDTYTQISEFLPGGFVDAYDADGFENLSEINDGAGLGDGGLISNVIDLHIFYEALLQERTLLSAAMMDELLDFRPVDASSGYSLGLDEWQTEFGVLWGHGGGVLGFASFSAYLPDDDAIIVILSANEDFETSELMLDIIDEILFFYQD
ncbi:MAG: class A beta-lactamase-related serine hydrolase [Anaerolineaceae bacterium]|nr:MAG: class A beta-lactamase-related serine hydrolase [Anaerolineaceae bacterium]